ncbi:cold shock domain-containing protein [Streptomyces sp. NBC_01007]|nr:cold shock domain-containing protein [Streptomyces sp. NBC_01007]
MIDATVREWMDEEGWGVLDSVETPGGCWAHFSAVEASGFRSLTAGEKVTLEWESDEQDGFQYRAVRVIISD